MEMFDWMWHREHHVSSKFNLVTLFFKCFMYFKYIFLILFSISNLIKLSNNMINMQFSEIFVNISKAYE